MQTGSDGNSGMNARACCSIVALSKVTAPLDGSLKKEASSAWLGEKISTPSMTFLCASNVSGEQVLACGSQTYNGRGMIPRCVRSVVTSSICSRTISGMSKKWKHAADMMSVAARSVGIEGSGAVKR